MKLYIKLFNRKFDVSTSNSNVRRVYEIQLRIAKVQAEKDILKRAESELELVQELPKFLGIMLRLNKQQLKQLDNMDFEATQDAVGYICQRVLGQTDNQIAEEEKEDPKK